MVIVIEEKGKGTHVKQAPQTWRARGFTLNKHPKRNRTYYGHVVVSG